MTLGDAGRNPGDLMFRVAEIERKLNDIMSARRLESASIGSGGLRVRGGRIVIQDGQGQDAMTLSTDGLSLEGLLQVFGDIRVGSSGDIVIDGGELRQRVGSTFIPLAALAGGAEVSVVSAEQGLTESAGGDSAFVDLATVGPSVTFTTHTGKWVVMMFANVEAPGDGAGARMGYTASGAQSLSAVNSRSSLAGVNVAATTGGFFSTVYVNVHTGQPGQITVTAKYRLIASASFPAGAGWANRAVIVIPY